MLKRYLTMYNVGDFLTELNKISLSRFFCLLSYTLKIEYFLLNIRHSFRFTHCQCWRYSRLCFHNYIVYSVCIQPIYWPALKILYFNINADDAVILATDEDPRVVSALLQQHMLVKSVEKGYTCKCNHITFTLRKDSIPSTYKEF